MHMGETIAILGPGVMSRNPALNFRNHGLDVPGYDPDPAARSDFLAADAGRVFADVSDMVGATTSLRFVMLMIPAGTCIDDQLAQLMSLLSASDVVVDGGNSQFRSTEIRMIVLVMGVSGVGKSTIGVLLATALGGQYIEGDGFHPPANLAKMRVGLPLSDEDRLPWLQALGKALQAADRKGEPVVLGCSALRESYRQLIRAFCPYCQIVWLHGSPELVAARIKGRQGHFMPASLLSSQFAIL